MEQKNKRTNRRQRKDTPRSDDNHQKKDKPNSRAARRKDELVDLSLYSTEIETMKCALKFEFDLLDNSKNESKSIFSSNDWITIKAIQEKYLDIFELKKFKRLPLSDKKSVLLPLYKERLLTLICPDLLLNFTKYEFRMDAQKAKQEGKQEFFCCDYKVCNQQSSDANKPYETIELRKMPDVGANKKLCTKFDFCYAFLRPMKIEGFLDSEKTHIFEVAKYYVWQKVIAEQQILKVLPMGYIQKIFMPTTKKDLLNIALVCKTLYNHVKDLNVFSLKNEACPKCKFTSLKRSISGVMECALCDQLNENTQLIPLGSGQKCGVCDMALFHNVRIKNVIHKCFSCEQKVKLFHTFVTRCDELNQIKNCFDDVFRSSNFTFDELKKLSLVCKASSSICKTIMFRLSPGSGLCMRNKNPLLARDIVIVTERSLSFGYAISDDKYYFADRVPELKWAKCIACLGLFFVKRAYLGTAAKCLMCRLV